MSERNNQQEFSVTSPAPPPVRIRRPRRTQESRAGITFPISRVHQLFREGNHLTRYRVSASIYVAAVLEYVSSEILEAAGWETLNSNRKKITPNDVRGGIKKDTDLRQLLGRSGSHLINAGYVQCSPRPEPLVNSESSNSFVSTFLRSRRRSNKH